MFWPESDRHFEAEKKSWLLKDVYVGMFTTLSILWLARVFCIAFDMELVLRRAADEGEGRFYDDRRNSCNCNYRSRVMLTSFSPPIYNLWCLWYADWRRKVNISLIYVMSLVIVAQFADNTAMYSNSQMLFKSGLLKMVFVLRSKV